MEYKISTILNKNDINLLMYCINKDNIYSINKKFGEKLKEIIFNIVTSNEEIEKEIFLKIISTIDINKK